MIQTAQKDGTVYKSSQNAGWRLILDSNGKIINRIKATQPADNPFPGRAHSKTHTKKRIIEIPFDKIPEKIKPTKREIQKLVNGGTLEKEEVGAVKAVGGIVVKKDVQILER